MLETISRLLKQCKSMRELKQIHAKIITFSFLPQTHHDFFTSRLLFFCALSDAGDVSYAVRVFRLIQNPGISIYNIMIRASASNFSDDARLRCIDLYKRMLGDGIGPDFLTFPFLIKDCARRGDDYGGSSVHGQAIRFGLCGDLFVQNSLVSFYAASGFLSCARKVFDEMPHRDVVSWNAMIIGYLRCGSLGEALDLFRRMEKRNVITWNSIITGLARGGQAKMALEIFNEMLNSNHDIVRPDKVTIASVISACAYLGTIDQGKWVHEYLRRSGIGCDLVISTALVDMYGKCGSVERAYAVFKEMPKRDVSAWTAMISAFALNGYGKEAFDIFEEMESAGTRPNQVTFVALLSACAHSGLVEKGRWCFNKMKHSYSIEPQAHHYACMVDILSRAGLFDEVEGLIRNMPIEPDVFVWGALLGGCQMHGNVELGERIAQFLISKEPTNHAFYVNWCDVYAKAGRYEDVKRVRTLMKERGVKKEVPGCSMIEVDGVVLEFSAGGSSNTKIAMEELNHILNVFSNTMKFENSKNGNH